MPLVLATSPMVRLCAINFPPSLKCANDKPSSGKKVKRISYSRPACTGGGGDGYSRPAKIVSPPREPKRPDRERDNDEPSLGRGGDRQLARPARSLRADLRPTRPLRAPLPRPPGGRRSRRGAGPRAVPDRIRAAQDVRRAPRDRPAVPGRDRPGPLSETPRPPGT